VILVRIQTTCDMTPTMTSVSRVISEVTRRAEPGSVFSLFLDFDGTLIPIAEDPTTPRLADAARETLRRVCSQEWCVTTIISGRAIDDLYERIGVDGPIYAGNHGLEIRGRGLDFVQPTAAALRERLERLSKDLMNTLRPVAGAFVEYKGLTTGIHYRRVGERDVVRVEDAVRGALEREGDDFRLKPGKKVFEIVPWTNWHKGVAARWINRHLCLDEYLSIFFGDDTTDEDAFSTLTKAITVEVAGTGFTSARYRFPDPQAVHQFLEWMAGFEPPGQ
jgi:trehalose 6-phosphate phosphatase